MLHSGYISAGGNGSDRRLQLMSRICDEPLLPLDIFRKRTDCIPGKEHNQPEDHNQAADACAQGHKEQSAHGLQGIRHIQEQHRNPRLILPDQIPEVPVIAPFLSF